MTLGLLAGGAAVLADPTQRAATAPQAWQALPADQQREFVARVLGDTEDVWGHIFRQMGKTYQPPKLILFTGTTASVCGPRAPSTGPFYCAGDHSIYLERNFFQELYERYGVSGDFARAYVIAQQVGYHVQNQLGLAKEAQRKVPGAPKRVRSDVSVQKELQADCLAGVWANSAEKRKLIDARDIESGIAAAKAMGDDQIQQRTKGYVAPGASMRGTSEQRARWFKVGLDSGDFRACNTFASTNGDPASETVSR